MDKHDGTIRKIDWKRYLVIFRKTIEGCTKLLAEVWKCECGMRHFDKWLNMYLNYFRLD
jgi:hypothetical protein